MNAHPEQLQMLADVKPWLPDVGARKGWVGPTFNPAVLQPVWRYGKDLMVLMSVDRRPDGRWLHASFSRVGKMPDYRDMRSVRRGGFRAGVVVVHVFPPEAEYVNLHTTCLHLWERLDGPRLVPDLRLFDQRLGEASI